MTVTLHLCDWRLSVIVAHFLLLFGQPAVADSHDNNSQDGGSQDNRYYNNYNDDSDNDDDGNFVTRLADRVSADMSNMWQSAPNEWATEYWEVFILLAIVTFLILALHCCMVYDMCCGSSTDSERAHAGGRLPLTREQVQQREKEQRLLSMEQQQQEEVESQQQERQRQGHFFVDEEQHDIVKEKNGTDKPQEMDPTLNKNASLASASSVATDARKAPKAGGSETSTWNDWKRGSRKMYRVGKEVATVWSEFLGELMPHSSRDGDDNFQYRRHQQDDPSSQSRRNKKKRSPSRQNRRSSRRSVSGSVSSAGPSSPMAAAPTAGAGDAVNDERVLV